MVGRDVAVFSAVPAVAVKLRAFSAEEAAVLAVGVACQSVDESITPPNVRKREDGADGSTDSVVEGVTVAVGQCDGRALVNVFALVDAISLEASVAGAGERAVRVRASRMPMALVKVLGALVDVGARVGGVAGPTSVADAAIRVHVARRADDTSHRTSRGEVAVVAGAGERAVRVRARAVVRARVCALGALVDVGARVGGVAGPTGVADAAVRVHVARVTRSAGGGASRGEVAVVAGAGERAVRVRARAVSRA